MICLTECWMWGYMRNTWRRCQDSLVYAPQTSAHLLWAQVFALQRTWAWCWVDGIEPVIVSCALVSTLWMILWLTRYMFYAYLYTYNESYICMYCMQNLVCFEGIRAIKLASSQSPPKLEPGMSQVTLPMQCRTGGIWLCIGMRHCSSRSGEPVISIQPRQKHLKSKSR